MKKLIALLLAIVGLAAWNRRRNFREYTRKCAERNLRRRYSRDGYIYTGYDTRGNA